MDKAKKNKHVLSTEIIIQASPQKVWDVLSDFDAYPQWSSFVKSVKGEVKTGKKIAVLLHPPQGNPMMFKPTVLTWDEHKKFSWLGHLLVKGLFDGEHIFELVDNQDGTTTFKQSENFNGILVPFLRKMLDGKTKQGFDVFNEQIKQRVESRFS